MNEIYEGSKTTVFTYENASDAYSYHLIRFAAVSGDRFGVCIRLVREDATHEKATGDLFSSREGALRFLAFLYRHRASPSNLSDVIEDILSDFGENA